MATDVLRARLTRISTQHTAPLIRPPSPSHLPSSVSSLLFQENHLLAAPAVADLFHVLLSLTTPGHGTVDFPF